MSLISINKEVLSEIGKKILSIQTERQVKK